MVPLRTSWQLERSTSSLKGKKSDLGTASKWSERSGSASWWMMSSLVSLKTLAKVKAKAKSLSMTALKNVTKLLDPGLSVPHPHKRLSLTIYLLFRILMLKPSKSSWKLKQAIFQPTISLWSCRIYARCSPKRLLWTSCRPVTVRRSPLLSLQYLVEQDNYLQNNTLELHLLVLYLVEHIGLVQ